MPRLKLRTLPREPPQLAPDAVILVHYTRCDLLSMSSTIAAIRPQVITQAELFGALAVVISKTE
jgi:hypothetical protein